MCLYFNLFLVDFKMNLYLSRMLLRYDLWHLLLEFPLQEIRIQLLNYKYFLPLFTPSLCFSVWGNRCSLEAYVGELLLHVWIR